ncbi:MAG: hypothetical protein K2L99_01355, partial [Muribaculaceae bacterium]|nr:hypothetical protein [Muribaculaceae bacterium]
MTVFRDSYHLRFFTDILQNLPVGFLGIGRIFLFIGTLQTFSWGAAAPTVEQLSPGLILSSVNAPFLVVILVS